MSFQQGLSGLAAANAALNVIGNNVANVSTVGFKSGDAHFADLFASSLGMLGSSQIGIGVNVAAIQQQFTQGNLTTTNNPLDLAINGNGFFRMSNSGSGAISYSRNGQFELDKDGFIINDQNLRMTGYTTASPSVPVDLNLSASILMPPKETIGISAGLNLDAGATPIPAAPPFSSTDPTTYNFSTGMTVYDSLGVNHNLTTFYALDPTTPLTWHVFSTLDGLPVAGVAVGDLVFDPATGTLDAATLAAMPFPAPAFTLASGATVLTAGTIDFTGTTQYDGSGESTVNTLAQDGYAPGSLAGLGVDSDGVVQGRYSNNQSRNLGQVVLATFANPNGLQNLGNNQWTSTSVSGLEVLNKPGSGASGLLQSAATEDSNVDLTTELVDMITAQRNYQANAQTIKTQDAVMQTLLNLR